MTTNLVSLAGLVETSLEHIKHLHAQMNMNSLQLGKGPSWKRKVRKTAGCLLIAYIEGDFETAWVNIWVIHQTFGQDGWILAKFYFFAWLWTEMESSSINLQKKKERG